MIKEGIMKQQKKKKKKKKEKDEGEEEERIGRMGERTRGEGKKEKKKE